MKVGACVLIVLMIGSVAAGNAASARKKIITFGDFEKSYLYKQLAFSRVKTVLNYRIYKDVNHNYIVALQTDSKGRILTERVMPIPRVPSKAQNSGMVFFVLDFICGNRAALEDMATSKELGTYVQQFPQGVQFRGFTIQMVQDPWKKRAGLEIRTSKSKSWDLSFTNTETNNMDSTFKYIAKPNQTAPTINANDESQNKTGFASLARSSGNQTGISRNGVKAHASLGSESAATDGSVALLSSSSTTPSIDYDSLEYYCEHASQRIRVKWLPASNSFTGSVKLHCRINTDGSIGLIKAASTTDEEFVFQNISEVLLHRPPKGEIKVSITFNQDIVKVTPE